MTGVSRLSSRPQCLLETDVPSPAEIRKLLLAHGMMGAPKMLVLDEPTDHLDTPSIEALEAALAEYPRGIVLVSHDERFLEGLAGVKRRVDFDRRGTRPWSPGRMCRT